AQSRAANKDLDEDSPDHLGADLDVADAGVAPPNPAPPKPVTIAAQVVPAAITQKNAASPPLTTSNSQIPKQDSTTETKPNNGTIVLDVEEGGIEVPSFIGKNVRAAIEQAQDAGLDLDAVGSGVAKDQTPSAGSKVAAGATVVVRFGR